MASKIPFFHLRTHSAYSFLRALPEPADLAQAAARDGMSALALTDHHSLTGAIEFYDACQNQGLHPILGLEVMVAAPPDLGTVPAGELLLLAINRSGWTSLCRISSMLTGDEAILPFEKLTEENSGLICLSGGRRSSLYHMLTSAQEQAARQGLDHLKEIFPERLYVELQVHDPGDEALASRLFDLSQDLHLPSVATHDIHYLTPEQAHLQRILTAIRLNQPLAQIPPQAVAPPNASFISRGEMVALFKNYPSALTATEEIAGRCQLELPLGSPLFPEIPLPPGQTALEVLRRAAEAGAYELYVGPSATQLPQEVRVRLDHELTVIEECGYATLFLIVKEILDYARHIGAPVSSRGSAASSLVAHCLGITSPDPLGLNLYFERFLNPVRLTPPDIDTDLCSRRRDEVIRFVYKHFGEERVATVCTVNRFRRRSALREVSKAYALPAAEVKMLAESLPRRWYGPAGRRRADEDAFIELAEQYKTQPYQSILRDAKAILGLPHHLSVHPGGIVITPGTLTDLVPTQMATKGVTITQLDLDSIERMGLVKIDLLGIRGLTVLGDVAQAITEKRRADHTLQHTQKGIPALASPASPLLEALEAIPEDDPATSALLQRGDTIGCFQIESLGMRATLREIRAHSVDDLMIALALFRPGPMTGGLKDDFVRRHRGLGATTHLHPALAPLLEETHGIILYQEQVLRIAHELAGLSLADADLLRRAMSHFDPGKQMQTLKEKFIAGSQLRHGVPPETAERIWELMAAFAGYGFPKAHAASYAQVAWRSAWCKAHYPAIFMAAVLANWGGYYPQSVYLTEARRIGLAIRPPQVNYAEREFCVKELDQGPTLFMGLDQVRDLTRRTQAAIISQRPFQSLQDFLSRVDPRPVEAGNLIRAGAFKGFGPIPGLLRQLEQGGWQRGQLSLFSLESEAEPDWSLAERVAAQEEILGVGVDAHPLELVKEKIAAANALTTLEAAARLNQRVRVAGVRQIWRRIRTAQGDFIYFMAFEDLHGILDVVIFSNVYLRYKKELTTKRPYIVEGPLGFDEEKGEPYIRAERIISLD